jgi:hypothetical protein
MFSQAGYQLLHPEADPKGEEVFLAGVEGTLETYEAIRRSSPDTSYPLLDELSQMRSEDKLGKYVKKRHRKCK